MLMKDKVALVTGASRGIGAATAKELAGQGAKIVVNYRESRQRALEVVSTIEQMGGCALAVCADVRDAEAVHAMVVEVTEVLGPIDILVMNAHIDCALEPFLSQDWDTFSSKLDGEMRALYFICQEVVPGMRARGSGHVIAISSLAAHKAEMGMSAQCAAKAGLEGLMRSLAVEWGRDGIRVNTVAPGLIDTELIAALPEGFKRDVIEKTALGRVGRPEDVAEVVTWLASTTGYMSGVTLPVNGGLLM